MTAPYISVRIALYDFTPESDDSGELAVRKGDTLLLLDTPNDDWWRFKLKTERQNNNGSSGFVPREYTQEAQFISLATASGDFTPRADSDLTITENETLLVYAGEKEWALVTSPRRYATGYVSTARIQFKLETEQTIALYDYSSANSDELSFKQAEILTFINHDSEGWWYCANKSHKFGLVPYNYVKPQLQVGPECISSMNTPLTVAEDGILRTVEGVGGTAIDHLATISSTMSVNDVLERLSMYGIRDCSSFIDGMAASKYPIASGTLCDIYSGRLLDGTRIALKARRVILNDGSADHNNHLKASQIDDYHYLLYHWSVLPLLGLAIFREQIVTLSHWVEEGRLSAYLERTPGVNLYKISIDICRGLAYLHSVGVIHGNVRLSNILVSREGLPLLTGFGNSWLINPSIKFTPAPELFVEDADPSKPSDVYALGMTLYEVMAGQVPYKGIAANLVLVRIIERIMPRRPESIPEGYENGDSLWDLLLRCWSYEPMGRPTSTEVENSMVAIYASSIQSRKMAPHQVVSHLVLRGCQDISNKLELSSFKDYPTITEGGFSDIYKGRFLDGTAIALKVLRVSVDSVAEHKHLRRAADELHTWQKCSHPNIMPLLGLTVFRDRIGMASLWMKHGNLPGYLKKEPSVNRINMCAQISEGLAYLHENEIIHCDLKGANVLVSDEGNPVLADFGTSLALNSTLRFTPTTGGASYTLRWSAAEIVKETHPHTEASDVYALGMTIYEVISGKIPYEGKGDYNVIFLVAQGSELPERFERMPNGERITDELWALLTRCWSYEREARPSANVVMEAMKGIAGI
ncbi:Tyrosine-protein kinase JAK1 OS=Homo sapiens GN=JAK1 PE=1 SV=2 [Rhizoctonia solani AG-1 IB]|uniref:mitogen-activated protein kinase kinase kinase n=1 Tax=Thanatephorus cucumeris (strain AG1-IB / isolate 7/3/14) TaxID=1108050 RepID=A0A0B7FZ89_THACB|nr:Tyrosine-protein kinase JAK1 OS=Homo sapiens GN=JAK1 PE=1 SV=2 [Rhizoctonia solani AG-1 IB]